jgi:hypothetical protein
VLRLDLATGKVLARINTGAAEPGAITAGHGLVWVTHYGAGHLLVGIDPHSNTIVRRTKLPGESCCQPAVLGSTVWVAAGSEDAPAIVGVNARTGRIVRTLSGMDGPVVVNGQLWASMNGDTVIVNPRDGNVTTTAAQGTVLWQSPSVAGLAWGMQDGAAVGMTSDGTVARTVIAPGGLKLSYTEGMAITSGQTVWVVSEISLWRIDSGAKTAVLAAKLPRDVHSITGDGKGGVWMALFFNSRMQHFPA